MIKFLFVLFAIIGIITLFIFRSLKKKRPTPESRSSYDDSQTRFDPVWLRISSLISFGVSFVLLILLSYQTVDSGHVKVAKLFGKIQPEVLTEGLHFVNPLKSWTDMNIQRNSIQADDGDQNPGMTSTTADNNQATVLANFSYMLNPEYAWWVLKHIGDETKFRTELLEKAAQSATRDAVANFKLEDAQIGKRSQFEQKLQEQFADNVLINLPQKDLDSLQLRKIFSIYPTQLMDIKPDPKVANALAEKKATEINLEQQTTLTAIAKEQGNRKEAEGTGIRKLIDELPEDMSAADVALILRASADKTRAEAFMRAVTDGKISFGMFEGSSARIER